MKKTQETESVAPEEFDLEMLTQKQRQQNAEAKQWTVSTSDPSEMALLERARKYAERTRGRSFSKIDFFRCVVNDWIKMEREKRE